MLTSKMLMTSKRYTYLFVFSLLILTPLPNIGTDIFTPSLPSITKAFNSTPEIVKLTIVFYLITYGLGQLIFGILSDMIGRRMLLLIGVFSFTVFNIIIFNIHFMSSLLVIRLLQGLAAAIVSVITKAIISDKFRGKRLIQISTAKVNIQIISIIIGPIIGAFLQEMYTWKYCFIALGIYGFLATILTTFSVPETHKKCNRITQPNEIYSNIVSALSDKRFCILLTVISALYASVSLFGVSGPFLIQNKMGSTAIFYGQVSVLLGFIYLSGSYFSSNVILKTDLKLLLYLISSALLLIATFLGVSGLIILLPIMMIMLLNGMLLPGLMAEALGFYNKRAGLTSALIGAIVMLGSGTMLFLISMMKYDEQYIISISYFLLSIIIVSLVNRKHDS